MSALSDLLQASKGDRSIDDVVRHAGYAGFRIDRTVVSRALNGEHAKTPRAETLEALAAGFGIDPREVRAAAGAPPGEAGPYIPTPEASSLTAEQRKALDLLIKSIVRGAASEDQGARVTMMKPARMTDMQQQAAYNPEDHQ